jgi:hypothetical protein
MEQVEMTNEDIVQRLRLNTPCFDAEGNKRKLCGQDGGTCPECRKKQDAADLIEAQAAEIERLRGVLKNIAGSSGKLANHPEYMTKLQMIVTAQRALNTRLAPKEFCEWTRDAEASAFNPSCDELSKWTYADPMDDPGGEGYRFCPSCGKPISFKETP